MSGEFHLVLKDSKTLADVVCDLETKTLYLGRQGVKLSFDSAKIRTLERENETVRRVNALELGYTRVPSSVVSCNEEIVDNQNLLKALGSKKYPYILENRIEMSHLSSCHLLYFPEDTRINVRNY